MKRLILGLLVAGLCVVTGVLFFGWPYLVDRARQQIEATILRAIDRPTHIDELSVSLIPLRVRVRGLVIGSESTLLGRVQSIEARVWVLSSLVEWRPVLSVNVASADVDLSQLPTRKSAPAAVAQRPSGPVRLPSLRLQAVDLSDVRIRFPLLDAAAAVSVVHADGRLQSRSATTRATADLTLAAVQLERAGQHLALDEIIVSGGLDSEGVFLTSARVRGEAINAVADAKPPARDVRVDAKLDLAPVAPLFELPIAGHVQIDGTLSGDLANPGVDAEVTIQQAALHARRLGDISGHVARDGTTVRLADLHAIGDIGELSGTIELVAANDFPVRGTVSGPHLDIDTVLTALDVPLQFQEQVKATASVNGSLAPLALSVQASGAVQASTGGSSQELARLDVRGRVDASGFESQIEVVQPQQNRISGNLALKNGRLDGRIVLAAQDLSALSQVLPIVVRRLSVAGRADGTIQLAGPATQPVITAAVTAGDLRVVGVPVRQVTGDFSIENSKLTVRTGKIDTGSGGADLTGTVALGAGQNDWRLEVHELTPDFVAGVIKVLADANTPVSGGTLNGSVRGQGTWAHVDLEANLTAQSIVVFHEPVERIALRATSHWPQWTAHAEAVHSAAETLTIDGSGSGLASMQLSVDSGAFNLAKFRGVGRRHVSGTVVLRARLSGEVLRPNGVIDASASGLARGGHMLGDVVMHADGHQGEWTAGINAFGETLQVAATLRTNPPQPYTVDVRWTGTELAPLISDDRSLRVTTSGELTLAGSLRMPLIPSGTVRIDRFEAARDQYHVANAEPIRLDVDNGRVRIRSLILAAEGSRLTLTGGFSTAGDLDVQAQGEADLVLLELIGPPFSSARGQVTVAAHAGRSAAAGLSLQGQAQLRDATLDLGLPIAFTAISGDCTLVGSRIRIDTLDAKAGGGTVHVSGTVDLAAGPDLSWAIEEIAVNPQDDIEVRASGEGQIAGTWKRMTVSGDVEVLNALYDRNVEVTDLLTVFKAKVQPAPRAQAPSNEVRLDVHIHAPGGLYVDNDYAKVEMRADLRIRGAAEKPVLSGTIEFLTGEVTFHRRTFTITGGALDFRDPFRINPVLNITAESLISTADADYTVSVAITGTADEPRVQFAADDPNLSQNDIVSLVTFGKTSAQAQREGGGVSAADVLALVPTGVVSGHVGKLVGIDRFEVDTTQARNTGAVEPRVTIGKDLTDRFRASVSSSFGVEAQRTVQLEYRITRRMSLLSAWEGQTQSQAGAFEGDIKFRYDFRRVPFSLFGGGTESSTTGDAPH
jgi:autotransporter translocation and assembly factor TamB